MPLNLQSFLSAVWHFLCSCPEAYIAHLCLVPDTAWPLEMSENHQSCLNHHDETVASKVTAGKCK